MATRVQRPVLAAASVKPVDIHKPKPWHGFREFLKEYLIIVVGVLTALGAEQAVEQCRWRERVEAAEALIQRSLSVAQVLSEERMDVAACQDRRLAVLEDRLLQRETT